MKYIFIVFLIILGCLNVSGQKAKAGFPDKSFYKYGKITWSETQFAKVKNISIVGDSVCFNYRLSQQPEWFALADLEELKVKTGSRAVAGAILGAVIPFILILESLVDNEPNVDNAGWLVAGTLAGGALIGGGIGLAIPVYKSYPLDRKGNEGLALKYRVQFNSKMIGAGVQIRL
jgi:hypothetical protein